MSLQEKNRFDPLFAGGSTAPIQLLLAVALVFAGGCTASADIVVGAGVGEDFELAIGQSARVTAKDIEVGFLAVASDSRCAKDVVCIWEGDAVVRIWVRQAGGDKEEHELHTAAREMHTLQFAGHSIRLVALFPPPVADRQAATEDYRATLRIDGGSARNPANYQ